GGVVNASAPGTGLLFNATNAVNQGLLEASGGGTLQIDVPVINAGGTIEAQSGSIVQLQNGTHISGGTLTSGTGLGTFFGTVQSTVVLDGNSQGPLSNATAYTINNGTDTQILGIINNTGSFVINAGGNGTALSAVGGVTLTGGGSVNLTNNNA